MVTLWSSLIRWFGIHGPWIRAEMNTAESDDREAQGVSTFFSPWNGQNHPSHNLWKFVVLREFFRLSPNTLHHLLKKNLTLILTQPIMQSLAYSKLCWNTLGRLLEVSQVQPSLKSILVQHMIWVLKSPFFYFWKSFSKKLERKLVLTKCVSSIETKARMINHIHKWNHGQVQIFWIRRN